MADAPEKIWAYPSNIADSESDEDIYRQMDAKYAVAGVIRVGHFRSARTALASLEDR